MTNETGRIRRAVEDYAADRPAMERATQAYVGLVTRLLDDAGINYHAITGRTKTVESYAGKAARRAQGTLVYPDPAHDITDAIGVRVVAYVLSDVDAVARLLSDHFVVLEDRDMGRETAAQGRFGYSSRHLLITHRAGEDPGIMAGCAASVQIRTVLQHAWAEFEHDIRYKGTIPPEAAPDIDRRFTLAAGLLDLADREFSTIRHRLRTAGEPRLDLGGSEDPRIGGADLAAFLAGQFTDAGWSRMEHYTWASGLLLELGITSLQELRDVLRGAPEPEIARRMDYRFPPGAVRRLDDALLWLYGERYIALHDNAHRVEPLRSRLARLHPEGPAGPEGE